MIIDLQQLDEIKYQFTQLGMTVSDLSSKNEDYFKSIMKNSEKLNDLLTTVIPDAQLDEASKHIDTISSQVEKVDTIIGNMTGSFGGIGELGSSLDALQNKFSTLSNDIQSVKKDAPEKDKKAKEKKKGKPGLMSSEINSVLGKFKQFLSALKVPAMGALLAGGIGILAYGEKERQRLKAEQGEVSDILVTAVDGHIAKIKDASTEWLSGFQERMQKFYGIAKSEIQAAAKVFSDGGIRIEEWMKGRDEKLGVMGSNLYSFSIGVDKLLNVAGGTTASSMVDYAERYGMSLKESKETIMKMLEVGGSEDGLGFVKFTKMVNETAPALERLGFSVSSTADFMAGMQEHLTGLKIPKQLAGNLLVKGVQSMAAGISSLSNGWKMAIAEELGYGKGIKGIQKFDDYWQRLRTNKEDPEALAKFINKIVGAVLKWTGGDQDQAKYLMKEGWGLDSRAAFLAMESHNASKEAEEDPTNKAKGKKAKKAGKRAVGAVAASAKTEAEKRTEWERHMNLWMKGLSKIGMGMLGLTATWLSRLVLYFRLIPQYLENIFEGIFGDKRNARLANDKLDQFVKDTIKYDEGNFDQLKDGWNDLKKASKGMLNSTFGKTIDGIEKSMTTELPSPFDFATGDRENARQFSGSGVTEAPSTVRTVAIPISGGSITEARSTDYLNAKEAGEKQVAGSARSAWEDFWKGTKPLRIVSYGADQQGDIKIALVGECPRCGLSYDEGFDEDTYKSALSHSTKDEEVLAMMLFKEAGGGAVNTEQGRKEMAMIGHTALNRLENDPSKYGGSLENIITGGHGYGKQGDKRAYATNRERTKQNEGEYQKVLGVAKDLLAGGYQDQDKGQTHFIHNTMGDGYGSDKSGWQALPDWADPNKKYSLKNLQNSRKLRTYGRKGQDAPDRDRRDTNMRRMFVEKHSVTDKNAGVLDPENPDVGEY